MWVSKRFDLSWSDLVFAGARCLRSTDRAEVEARVEAMISPAGAALACLSVRSAFDLFLEAHALPRGSDIVFSAMTVADMPRIAREHGLNPVPCDLAPGTAAPGIAELERACKATTRAVVLAHLFGSRVDVAPLVDFCHARRILVVEDCAQAYAGRDYAGHPHSDLVLFSFGPIKHATALGGGLAVVRDPAVRDCMRAIHGGWPEQPRREYLQRVAKYAGLHALSLRPLYTVIAGVARAMGVDMDGLTNRLTRGFAGPEFFRRIRRRPSSPLLETLARRLGQDIGRFERQEARVRELLDESGLHALCPGASAVRHTFWLLPIVTSDQEALISELRAHRFDASRGRSFAVVGEDGAASEAGRIQRLAVYVPVYPAMSDGEVQRLGAVLRNAST
jgi:dTDP-4-amino-4,6-dideoxygalactose transaminase